MLKYEIKPSSAFYWKHYIYREGEKEPIAEIKCLIMSNENEVDQLVAYLNNKLKIA